MIKYCDEEVRNEGNELVGGRKRNRSEGKIGKRGKKWREVKGSKGGQER